MGGQPLLPWRGPQGKGKRAVPLADHVLLARGEFQSAVVADLNGAPMPAVDRGDVLMVRRVGWFAVMVHLACRQGKSSVWVAQVVNGALRWGPPTSYDLRTNAALDALKLVEVFEVSAVGGD